ncbi:MAG TPA: hypothetical protein DC015_13485, partial [Aequorivita sp.]|nr:hypothetical protein [Aequorivita sp.]
MTIEEIKEVVDSYYGIDIKTESRATKESHARFVYFALCKKLTNSSKLKIGKLVNRNHATVINGLNKFNYNTLEKKYYDNYSDIMCMLFDENKIEMSTNYKDYQTYKKELKEVLIFQKARIKAINSEYLKYYDLKELDIWKKIIDGLKEFSEEELVKFYETRQLPFEKM